MPRKKDSPAANGNTAPEGAEFIARAHPAIQPYLSSATDIPGFLQTVGQLLPEHRLVLIEQALVLLESTYVHLPLKRAMHAIDPVQRLRLLKYQFEQTPPEQLPGEIQFHKTLTDIFTSTRDLHTNYLLPSPFNQKVAFLPFLIEEYFEDGQRKYLLSKVASGFRHPIFKPGVEILYWNGVPIERAVELNGEHQAGSNLDARRAQGLAALTERPLIISAPPDEEWVVITYRTATGRVLDFKQRWMVFSPDPGGGAGVAPAEGTSRGAALGLDIQQDWIGRARKILFAPEAVAAEQRIEAEAVQRAAPPEGSATSMPGVFRAQEVETPHGKFAYIRIFTFNVQDADEFVNEFVRLVEQLPQNGLIIDVRGNGGGLIYAAERLLQVLTPRRIEPEGAQFINTPLIKKMVQLHAPSELWSDFDLSPWLLSITQSVTTGAPYSLGVPITAPESCNAVGQKYNGPVLLITDALCYSATDIFAAGFQDHEIGPILGVHGNTGAGGANVWTHGLLQLLFSIPTPPYAPLSISPFLPLPFGADMRVAIRRTMRVGRQAGIPVEDLGVVPDELHRMTKADLLEGNVDLIRHAASILAGLPVFELTVKVTESPTGKHTLQVSTKNLSRLDVFLNQRPHQSLDVSDGTTTVEITSQLMALVELQGYKDGRLVAAKRLVV